MAVELDDVRAYLGAQPGSGPLNDEVLQDALEAAIEQIKMRCIPHYFKDKTWPVEIQQAVIMQAARLYRRRYSVSGYEGFGDLGAARVPAFDADVERLLDRYLRFDFA